MTLYETPVTGRLEGEMPKESFYRPTAVDGDMPDLTVQWGTEAVPQVMINLIPYDRSGINRLIATLRRARNQTYGKDE